MKKIIILSLIIFYLPLFQQCSDDNLLNNSFYSPSIFSEEVPANQPLVDEYKLSLEKLTEKKKTAIKNYLDTRKSLTFNSYDIIRFFFEDFNWGSLPFAIAFFLIIISIILSFIDKSKLMFILCSISFVLLFVQFAMFYFSEWLEDYEQIKIGFYLITLLLLFSMRESYLDWKRNDR